MSEGGTLRDQQAEFTRQVLMEAARRVIDKYPLEEFSIQKIAEEAGVSHRTIYRYFPSRQELLDAFSDWMEDTVAPTRPLEPKSVDDLPRAGKQAFDRFDRHAAYFRASLMLASRGEPIQPHRRFDRDQIVRDALADVLDPLDPEQAQQAYAIIRLMLSIETWKELNDRFELTGGRSGDAVEWAVGALIDALRKGQVPGSDPSGSRSDRADSVSDNGDAG